MKAKNWPWYLKTGPGNLRNQSGNQIKIGDYSFEVVDQFTYLGSRIQSNGIYEAEINQKIMTANGCYFGLLKQIWSKSVSKKTKCTIYKSFIRPVLTYRCEAWTMKKVDENKLKSIWEESPKNHLLFWKGWNKFQKEIQFWIIKRLWWIRHNEIY